MEPETTHDLESDLSALINEHGLISVLGTLQELVDNRAASTEATLRPSEANADSSDQSLNEQIGAFRDVSRALAALIKTLPPELDYEMALEQIAHTSSDGEDSNDLLSYGQLP